MNATGAWLGSATVTVSVLAAAAGANDGGRPEADDMLEARGWRVPLLAAATGANDGCRPDADDVLEARGWPCCTDAAVAPEERNA